MRSEYVTREGLDGALSAVREPVRGGGHMAHQRLAVIIVSYNTRDLLRECLRSVEIADERTKWLDVDIIVVDNASTDGSATMVAEEFPQVDLVASTENLGFAGGNNLALARLGLIEQGSRGAGEQIEWEFTHHAPRTTPDFVLLLNPDTVVYPTALHHLVTAFHADEMSYNSSDVGMVGAHLRYGDGSFQHGAFRFPSLAQIVLDLWPLAEIRGLRRLHEWLRDSRWNGRYSQELWQSGTPFLVDFVLGAAMMVRAEAVRQVGGLDSGYFMYCEEMDWALTMRRTGWKICAVPSAHVVHYEGQSSRQVRWPSFVQLWRSRFRFYRKHRQIYPPGYLLAAHVLIQLGIWMRGKLARHRFARGRVTGKQVAEELAAYRAVSGMK